MLNTSSSSSEGNRRVGFLLRLAGATSGEQQHRSVTEARRGSPVKVLRPIVIEEQAKLTRERISTRHLDRVFPVMLGASSSCRSHRLQVQPPQANNRRPDRAAAQTAKMPQSNQLLTIEFNSRAQAKNPQPLGKRKQILAQQVERTFRRKILGNLIVVSLAVLCLLAGTFLVAPRLVACQSSPDVSEFGLSESDKQTTTESSVITTSEPQTTNGPPANKLKPINFTLVDEIFSSTLSESEMVKRWRFMDSQLQDGMKSILKMLFPQIVAISQDAKVSGDCSGGILKWILSLRNLRSWAMKMLDATGKPTAGIFEGSLTMFGNYKQCLNIRAPDEDEIEITDQFEEYFRGQYCVIHLKPWMPIKQPFYHLNSSIESLLRKNYKYYEKTLYDELAEIAIAFNFVDIRLDLCVPSTCTVADIQRVAELLSKKVEMRAKVMRCDISPREKFSLFVTLDKLTLSWLLLPVTLLAISIASSIVVLILSNIRTDFGAKNSLLRHVKCLSLQDNFLQLMKRPKCCAILLSRSSSGSMNLKSMELSISASPKPSNQSDLEMNQDKSRDGERDRDTPVNSNLLKPLPLYGLRNVFVLWFIIVQLTVELKYQYLRESLPLRDMIINQWPMQLIVNSSLLFESLILITAFTFSFTCLECNLKDLIKYIVDKYLRLALSIASLIAITIVTPELNMESPLWKNLVDQQSMACKSTGYLNLFFLQNFISYEKICLPHTWLFSIELQLIVLSVPLMLLLKQLYLKLEGTFVSVSDGFVSPSSNEQLQQNEMNSIDAQVAWWILKSKMGSLQVGLIATGAMVNFATVYSKQLPPSWFHTFPDSAQKNFYFGEYLTKTWTHLSVFLLGLFGGHLCRAIKQIRLLREFSPELLKNKSPRGSPETGSTLTMASTLESSQHRLQAPQQETTRKSKLTGRGMYQAAGLVCMLAIIFSTHSWSTQQLPGPLGAALYDSLSRLIWSLALVYLMVGICLEDERKELTGSSSIAFRLFSSPICNLLGKLSFLAYLISPYVNSFILSLQEQALFPSIYMIFHLIVGNIVIIYTLASFLSVSIEQPVRRFVSRFVLSMF